MSASATMSTLNQPVVRRHRWLRRLTWFGAALLACFALYLAVAVPWMNRWGATDAEIAATRPGDELVPVAGAVTNRAVTVNAAPETIYPWLVQLGVDRGGMYSVLFVENLMGLHVTNAETIHPEWQTLAVSDFVRFTPKEYVLNPRPGLWRRAMEPPHTLAVIFLAWGLIMRSFGLIIPGGILTGIALGTALIQFRPSLLDGRTTAASSCCSSRAPADTSSERSRPVSMWPARQKSSSTTSTARSKSLPATPTAWRQRPRSLALRKTKRCWTAWISSFRQMARRCAAPASGSPVRSRLTGQGSI